MNDPKVIAIKDGMLVVWTAATRTANGNSPAFDMAMGASLIAGSWSPNGGGVPMLMVIPITSFNFGSGDEVYTFTVQDTPDGSTWTTRSRAATVGLNGTDNAGTAAAMAAAGGIVQIGFSNVGQFVRLVLAVAGTAPSIVMLEAYLSPAVNHLG